MKQELYILAILLFLLPQLNGAQAEKKTVPVPDDDLGIVTSKFQDLFYDALQQKAIENYDKAVVSLQKAIDLNPSLPILYFELGKNYNKLKNFGEAEDALKKAINKDPENEWYLDELYETYAKQKDFTKAIKTLKQLVKYHPDYKEDLAALYVKTSNYKDALKVLDDMDEEFGATDARDRLRHKIYNVTGQKKAQIKNLETRVEDNPDTEKNYLALIFRYSENGDKAKAFETAKKLLKINPKSQLVHLALYKFHLDDGAAEKAIKSMKIVLNSGVIKPEPKVKVLADFVNFVSKNPKYEADLIEVTSLVTEKSTDGKTFVELAQYYLAKGQKKKAIDYYLKAQVLEPSNYGLARNILLLYLDLDEYEIAQKKSAESIEVYPSQPVLYLINGVALNKLKRPQEAVETLEAGLDYIIENNKMEADFYNQLAKAHTSLSNLTKAKTFKNKAKRLESSN